MSDKFLGVGWLFIFSVFLFLPTIVHAEIFFQDDFESGNLNGWHLAYDDNGCNVEKWDTNNPRIVITTEDKASGSYSAKYINEQGEDCIYMTQNWSNSVGQGGQIYYRFRLKYAANYEWHGGNKVTEIMGDRINRDNGARVTFTLIRDANAQDWTVPVPNDPHQAIPGLAVWANDNVRQGQSDNTSWRPCNASDGDTFCQNINTANPVYVTAGQWYTIEIYVRVNTDNNNDGVINTSDVADGAVTLWINGVKVTEISNIYTISAPSQRYRTTFLGGTLNQPGYVNDIPTHYYFDDVIVSDTCNSCDEPSAQIINPTNSGTYTTTNTTINLSGTATDTLGTNIGITSVTWSNDRGGSGTASGTTNWSISNVPLLSGQNIITVTATDGDNKTGTDVLVVTLTTSGDTQAPSVPANLSAQAISSSQINLSWTASTDNVGVTGYRIYRCTGSSCTPSTQIATPTTTSYSNTGLSASTTYTYTVSAVDAAGNESLQSGSASATTSSSSGSGGGGDSGGGSSGGGGCGFVKNDDDGKGPRAKGEGLALIIVLIIALTVIFVLRRATKINHI